MSRLLKITKWNTIEEEASNILGSMATHMTVTILLNDFCKYIYLSYLVNSYLCLYILSKLIYPLIYFVDAYLILIFKESSSALRIFL